MPKSTLSKRDKYLLKRYGITDAEYQAMLAEQNGKCKICGKEPTGRPLHVDHDHSLRYYRLISKKTSEGWQVTTDNSTNKIAFDLEVFGRTKSEAVQLARLCLLRYSIRGLSCWKDNALLKHANDNPEILRNAAKYLEDYQQQLTQGGQSARQA